MNFGHMYANHTMPAIVDCNFVVDADNTNGLGISSLKSNGYVKNVFMHTSATPDASNPNPAVGIILVQLQDNYARLLSVLPSIVSPLTGSELVTTAAGAALTVGQPYVITTLGTNTAADWRAIGLPAGLTAAVGMNFIAIATGSGTGTGKVKAVGVSGIQSVEIVPNPQMELGPQGVSNQGAWLMLRTMGATNSSTTTMIPKAPAEDSVISLMIYLDNSSVTVDGD